MRGVPVAHGVDRDRGGALPSQGAGQTGAGHYALLRLSGIFLPVAGERRTIMAKGTKANATVDGDVLVVGGGLAGLTMAALLAQDGVRTVVVDRLSREAQLAAGYDRRTTAIAYGPRQTLEAADIWHRLGDRMGAILEIRITDETAPVLLTFDHKEVGTDPFGHIVDNRDLRRAQFDALDAAGDRVVHLAPAEVVALDTTGPRAVATLADGRQVRASLVVGADGRGSFVREALGIETRGFKYGQTAIVCPIAHEHPHDGVALEHFMPTGPFAILPLPDAEAPVGPHGLTHRSSLVWSQDPDRAARLTALGDADFAAALEEKVGDWLGTVWPETARAAYPLSVLHAKRYSGPRAALIGEAAHGMHPIAGQGLNVSLRDVKALAALVAEARSLGLDIGSPDLVRRYARQRRPDVTTMLAATDGLTRLFSNRIPAISAARNIGLGLVGLLPPVKGFFMRHAMGLTGRAALGR